MEQCAQLFEIVTYIVATYWQVFWVFFGKWVATHMNTERTNSNFIQTLTQAQDWDRDPGTVRWKCYLLGHRAAHSTPSSQFMSVYSGCANIVTYFLHFPPVVCDSAACRQRPSLSRQGRSSCTSTSAPPPSCKTASVVPMSPQTPTGTNWFKSIHGCWLR